MENSPEINSQPTADNPLSCFFRQPKIYISLPSQGKYYPQGTLNLPASNELPVFPMTAKDEIIMKTPDALLNGQAVVNVIKSCVPDISDPWSIPSTDIDVILVGIKIASYSENIEMNTKCPECKEESSYKIDLRVILDQLMTRNFNDTVVFDNPNEYSNQDLMIENLSIKLRPLQYKEITKLSLRNFEETRILNIVNDSEMPEDEKLQNFNEAFIRLTEFNLDLVINSIDSVTFNNTTVTDINHIMEFMNKADRRIFDIITKETDKNSSNFKLDDYNVTCPHCQHEYSLPITMDDAIFFVLSS